MVWAAALGTSPKCRDARSRFHDRIDANREGKDGLCGGKTWQQGHGGDGGEEEALGGEIQRRDRPSDGEVQRQLARGSSDGTRGLRRQHGLC